MYTPRKRRKPSWNLSDALGVVDAWRGPPGTAIGIELDGPVLTLTLAGPAPCTCKTITHYRRTEPLSGLSARLDWLAHEHVRGHTGCRIDLDPEGRALFRRMGRLFARSLAGAMTWGTRGEEGCDDAT